MRRAFGAITAVMLLAFGAQSVMAAYPEKPVTLVIPTRRQRHRNNGPRLLKGIG